MNSPLHLWHPFTNAVLDPKPLRVVKAEGVYLHTADGRKIVDAISSWWVNLHGHANPRIAAAIAGQARKLEHVILAGFTHDAAEELAARLSKWVPRELRHLFFSDDGSTAVEVALKLAVQHFGNLGRPEKCEIVALEHGYHGDTAGAMSVSDESPFTEPFRLMRYPVHRVHSAYCHRCPVGLKRESCHIECVQQLEGLLADRGARIAAVIVEPLLQGAGGMIVHPVEFLRQVHSLCIRHDVLLADRGARIAAVITEPLLQGAGGMIVHPVEFLRHVHSLCIRHDVLLIADEVLTGFGRTGKMFACDLANVVPDLMCISKGITGGFLPMGVTLCSDRVQSAFRSENRAHTFYHGHSYTGNALACAAANENLRIFDDEPVFDRISAIARIHGERLGQLREMRQVGDIRQIGSVGALELRAEDAGYLSAMRPKLYQFFLERGVLLRPLGNVVYVLPPYVIEPAQLHLVYDVIAEAIETLL